MRRPSNAKLLLKTATNLLYMGMFFGISNLAKAQNLVPNGSFEEGITCPTIVGNVTSECAHWYASIITTDGTSEPTPDWFHTCSEIDNYSPPDVAFGGFQYPQEGEGYIGMYCYYNSPNYREVVGVELIESLVPGNSYLVELYIANITPKTNAVSTNKVGFNFSTHPFYDADAFPINTSHYSVEELIEYSDDWFLISYVFVADSTYSFMHIGNFFDDENTSVEFPIENADRAYYAIDNVSVSEILSEVNHNSENKLVRIYPNPTKEVTTVSLKGKSYIEMVRLLSFGGTLIKSNAYSKVEQTVLFDLTEVAAGCYILEIVTPKSTYREKFIKL